MTAMHPPSEQPHTKSGLLAKPATSHVARDLQLPRLRCTFLGENHEHTFGADMHRLRKALLCDEVLGNGPRYGARPNLTHPQRSYALHICKSRHCLAAGNEDQAKQLHCIRG